MKNKIDKISLENWCHMIVFEFLLYELKTSNLFSQNDDQWKGKVQSRRHSLSI